MKLHLGIKSAAVALSAASLLAFTACGDDSNSSKPDSNLPDDLSSRVEDMVVGTFDNLPVCSGTCEGVTAYVKDENLAYVCVNGSWVNAVVSSSSEEISSSSFIPSDVENSSSSVNVSSSSEEVKFSSSEKVSSSSEISSSSINSSSSEESSSSVKSSSSMKMSSSSGQISSSSINTKQSSSSITGWSWDVPKETFLNPNIAYGTMTDKRDGKVYKTVKIGDQTWMAENLNYADSSTTKSSIGKSWCYNKDGEKCKVTGRLYTWAAAIDSVKLAADGLTCGYDVECEMPKTVQGICPEGWHLPSNAEWNTLFDAVGGSFTAGKILKSSTGWYDYDGKSGNGTDAFGLSALPAGYRYYNGSFGYAGFTAFFWSSTENSSYNAYGMRLFHDSENAKLDGYYKDCAFSIVA